MSIGAQLDPPSVDVCRTVAPGSGPLEVTAAYSAEPAAAICCTHPLELALPKLAPPSVEMRKPAHSPTTIRDGVVGSVASLRPVSVVTCVKDMPPLVERYMP